MMKFIMDMGITKKLIWIFILLILIPVSLTHVYAYNKYKGNIGENAEDYTYSIIDKMLRELDDSAREIERFSSLLLYYKEFEEELSEPGNSYDKGKKMGFYVDFLQNAMNRNSAVYILDGEGNSYFNNTYRPNVERKYAEWTKLAEAAEGKGVVAGTELVTDYFGQERYLLTTVRALRSRFDMHTLGIMIIDSDLTGFETIVNELDELTKGTTMIMDQAGQVILQSGSRPFTEHVAGLMARQGEAAEGAGKGKGRFRFDYEGQTYVCNYDTSGDRGWTMAVSTPTSRLFEDAASTRNATITITALAIGLAMLVAGVAVALTTRPIKTMESLMKDVQQGNFNIRFEVKHKDEIGRLGIHFNRMVQNIGDLIDQVYAMDLRKNKAELALLQSQINPHFLYNTLEMIRMAAEMNKDIQVSQMVFVLGKLLRYGVNRNGSTVTLEQEFEHIRNYLFLYNFRSGVQTALHVHVEQRFYDIPLMRLIFQPLVENSLLHGKPDDRPLTITIRAYEEEAFTVFEVRDNGVGISPERLAEVRDDIEGRKEAARSIDHMGIGLKNINDRIQLHYGQRYGLELASEPGEGTTVRVRLPAPKPASREYVS